MAIKKTIDGSRLSPDELSTNTDIIQQPKTTMNSEKNMNPERLAEIKNKIKSEYYNHPDILAKIAERLIERKQS